MEYDLTRSTLFQASSDLMTINLEDLAKHSAEYRAAQDIANPPAPEAPTNEWARLQSTHDSLATALDGAKASVKKANVRLKYFEDRVSSLKSLIKKQDKLNKKRGAGFYNTAVNQLEDAEQDVVEGKRFLEAMTNILKSAKERLSNFEKYGLDRIKELKSEIDKNETDNHLLKRRFPRFGW